MISIRKKKCKIRSQKIKVRKGATNTHSALQWVNLASVGLDLVSEFHGLLLGLTQCIIVLVHGLVQIRHLKTEDRRINSTTAKNHYLHFPCACLHSTLDLYHSSASAMLLAAMASYCMRMSLRAAVRSGLDISIWICTWVSWIWLCSSRISCKESRKSQNPLVKHVSSYRDIKMIPATSADKLKIIQHAITRQIRIFTYRNLMCQITNSPSCWLMHSVSNRVFCFFLN